MDIKKSKKDLLKNTGIIAIGTLCSKIVSFFLLPLYTVKLTTDDFGTVDVLQTIASLALPFVTLELSSAVFRFLIEDKNNKSIISSAFIVELINTTVFCLAVIIINVFNPIKYCGLFILYFFSYAFWSLSQNIARGYGNNKLYSFMSFLVTSSSAGLNILFILVFNMKGDSILLSASIAYVLTFLLAFFVLKMWKTISIKEVSSDKLKQMLSYCLPLIPNAISWWIANTSDRLIIRGFLGSDQNGIYAAANKIPAIYITLYNVYNIAWIEALAKSAGENNQESFINEMFQKSVKLFGCVSLLIVCAMSLFFNLLIGPDYSQAYVHIMILVIAIYINSMCSLVGGVFTSYKKSNIVGKTTIMGAITNIVINLVLVKFIGLYAASISTLVSYMVILFARSRNAQSLIKLRWPKSFIIQLMFVLTIVGVSYISRNRIINICCFGLTFIWVCYVNKSILRRILKKITNKHIGG